MKVEAGKEIEFVGYRLTDIVFLCENTAPVDEHGWEEYSKDLLRMIARSAREAQTAMNALACGQSVEGEVK